MDLPTKKYFNWPVVLISINVLAVLSLIAILGIGLTGNKEFLQNVVRDPQGQARIEQTSPDGVNLATLANSDAVCFLDVICIEPTR
jgi:hypothetical protein